MLVLLHPLPLDGSVWDESIRSLENAGHVIAPTMYPFGRSLTAWAEGVLDVVGPGNDRLVLVGNSIGGSCAIEIAAVAGDRVAAVVLVGAKPGHRPEPDLLSAALRLLDNEGTQAAWDRYWAPLFAPDVEPRIVETARLRALAVPHEQLVHGLLAFHTRADRSAIAETLDVPIVVVRGEHDVIPREPAALAASFRKGRFFEIAGAGHYVPVERPAALTEIVRAVLRSSADENGEPLPLGGAPTSSPTEPGLS